jgi:hypothetical protein
MQLELPGLTPEYLLADVEPWRLMHSLEGALVLPLFRADPQHPDPRYRRLEVALAYGHEQGKWQLVAPRGPAQLSSASTIVTAVEGSLIEP